VAFALSWVVLGYRWRGREMAMGRTLLVTFALLGIGFALTFPPVFYLLAGE
jgi:hypothetical protein